MERLRRQLRANPEWGYTGASPWSAVFMAATKDHDAPIRLDGLLLLLCRGLRRRSWALCWRHFGGRSGVRASIPVCLALLGSARPALARARACQGLVRAKALVALV